MTPATLVLLAPCSLLIGVLLQLLLARFLQPRNKGILAALCCLPAIGGVLAASPLLRGGQPVDLRLLAWDGPLQLAYHLDGLSFFFALMAATIGGAVLLYSISYMEKDPAATRFYSLMLVFIAGFIHLVYSADLFLIYLSWEIVGLCSFLLIGFWYCNPESARGARKVLVMTHLAGYGLLAAVILLYSRTGTTLWTDPRIAGGFTSGIFLLMFIAAVAKSVQFPLHTWIPDAMAAPTPVSALLHAACYVKAGVYLVARLHSLGPWPISWGMLVAWTGAGTLLVGVLFALAQHDLKRLLAFHTVSQIGYMMLGLGLGTPLGIAAALLHCLNHGLFKGSLFLCAGAVQHATGTRDIDQLGGLGRRMPRTLAIWVAAAGGISGVPLLNGFVSKWLLYNAALDAHQPVLALIPWIGSVLTVFSFLKATSGVFLGEDGSATTRAEEAPWPMVAGAGVLSAGCVVLGIAPQIAITWLVNPLLPALGCAPLTGVSWFGLTATQGVWFATSGLVLAVASALLGLLVYRLVALPSTVVVGGAALAGASGGVFTGGEPLSGDSRLSASDFSEILKQHLGSFFQWADMDRYYLRLWQALTSISTHLTRMAAWIENDASFWTIGAGAILLTSIQLFAPHLGNSAPSPIQPVPTILLTACAIAFSGLLISALTSSVGRPFAPLMALSGLIVISGLAVSSPQYRLALLEMGAAAAALLVWRSAASPQARWAYLTATVCSALALISGDRLLDSGQADWARALLLTGFFIKLAIIPLSFWLLRIVDDLPVLVTGLIITVLDMAAFGELYLIAQSAPWVITPQGVWLGAAVASSLIGSLLMLAQRDLKRLLVLATIEDLGFLLLGVASANPLGLSGALLGAAVHSLAKALLFISLSVPEADDKLKATTCRGLTALYPVSGAAFLAGMLAVLGVPPTLGFIARWRLYETAAQLGLPVLIIFVLSSAFALIAFANALVRNWWGTAAPAATAPRSSVLTGAVMVVFILALLAGGIWPSVLTGGIR
jgi:NADH:ubiquinone oxidoreductase subunit 5 (subunit L)/multisubunit Na+/H+ antiporter MnhA subunit